MGRVADENSSLDLERPLPGIFYSSMFWLIGAGHREVEVVLPSLEEISHNI